MMSTSKKNARREPLRHVRLDGYTLETWDTGRTTHDDGKTILAYEFRDPKGGSLFEGADFQVPVSWSIDSDKTLRSLVTFLTLRPGDTDREYFYGYTEKQMDFAKGDAEQLQMYADADGPEFENLDDFEPNSGKGFVVNIAPGIDVSVANYGEASKAVRLYIEKRGIGSSEWYVSPHVGDIRKGKKVVGHVSYNGRVWTADRQKVVREAAR